MRARTAALLSAAAVVTTAVAPSSAAAAVSPQRALSAVKRADSLDAPQLKGWQGFAAEYPLSRARFTSVAGVAEADGGCAYETKPLVVTRDRPVVMSRTRAVAREGCLEIVETGVPPADVVARWDTERAAAAAAPGPDEATRTIDEEAPDSWAVQDEMTPEVGVGDPPTPGYDASAGTSSISPGRDFLNQALEYHVWHSDPIYLHVNDVWQQLNWTHEGPSGCVRAASSSMSKDWLEQTGWYEDGANKRLGYTCSRAFSSAYAKFSNKIFCKVLDRFIPVGVPDVLLPFVPTTRVYYDRSVARGFNTGHHTGNTRWVRKGGCAFLLGFQRSLRLIG
ncbi:MAG TPA: hypothetical protein VF529_10070 [Solirubrobacteraceae bacterium]|jgi:hypothetical protein